MVKKCLYSSLHEKEAVGISEGAKDGGRGGCWNKQWVWKTLKNLIAGEGWGGGNFR